MTPAGTRAQTFVIVGASLAGGKAAETLREQGFDGRGVFRGDPAGGEFIASCSSTGTT